MLPGFHYRDFLWVDFDTVDSDNKT